MFGKFKIHTFAQQHNAENMYFKRAIDIYLKDWADRLVRKPVLLRGARQVGKSTAVRNLGNNFDNFVEINFERQPQYKNLFTENLVVERIVPQIAAMSGISVIRGYA